MENSKKKQKSTFALNLIKRRKDLGFSTAEEFAAQADIPYPTIRNIEAGVSEGSRKTRELIAKALNTTVDALNTPKDAFPMASSGLSKSQKIVNLIARLSSLDESQLDRLSDFMDTLSGPNGRIS